MSNCNLILIRGLPGSGKSTLADKLYWELVAAERSMLPLHFEADMYFIDDDGNYNFDRNQLRDAHNWCQNETQRGLASGRTVIVSNTFTTLKELKPYFDLIHKHDKEPTVYHCQNDWGSIHDVPEDTMKAMKQRFQTDISSLFRPVKV